MAASSAITVIGGTYGCRWRELQPITFGGAGRANADGPADASSGENGSSAPGAIGDEEMGFSRGRGRGRGRDAGGEYEMVGMKHNGGR